MLTILEQILLGLALAMDCFSVSLASGLILRRFEARPILLMALMFGLFQAMMPMIGWLATVYFGDYIQSVDHWIAFGLLAFIGVKMIIDHFKADDEKTFCPSRFSVICIMAVATSIDALAVGVSFTCMGIKTFADISLPVIIIGLTSSLLSLAGSLIGVYAGRKFRFPAELIGGIILIFIGIKVLFEHLT